MKPKPDAEAAVWLALDELQPREDNPRVITDAVVEQVAASIRRFGFGAPIVATASSRTVIAGHTRLRAARLLGLELVPVRLLDVSEEDARLLSVADNRLSGDWDVPLLLEQLRGLEDAADLAVIGFSEADLAKLMQVGQVEDEQQAEPRDEGDGPGLSITVSAAQREVFDQAAARFREREDDQSIPDGRIVELLSADYLSAP